MKGHSPSLLLKLYNRNSRGKDSGGRVPSFEALLSTYEIRTGQSLNLCDSVGETEVITLSR